MDIFPLFISIVVKMSAALRYFRFLAAASPGLRGDGASSYVDSVQCSGSGALPENAAGLVGKDREILYYLVYKCFQCV